jgi:hypothetical protein
VPTPEPSSELGELERAAKEASEETLFIIDLKEGREWYWSRLFALAGMAVVVGTPKLIILIGQRGGRPRQFGGSIRPIHVIAALEQTDGRYASAWQFAKSELQIAKSGQGSYSYYFKEIGEPVIMRILVDYMRHPERFGPGNAPIEPAPPGTSSWITLFEAEKVFDPWLNRQAVDLNESQKSQVIGALSTSEDAIAATRAGEYAGMVDVKLVERQVLKQLLATVK